MHRLILALLLGLTPKAFASGGVICEGVHPHSKLTIHWGTTRAIGSPMLGHVDVDWNGKHYVLGLEVFEAHDDGSMTTYSGSPHRHGLQRPRAESSRWPEALDGCPQTGVGSIDYKPGSGTWEHSGARR